MRTLTYGMNLSLDGYIAAAGDEISWSEPNDELFQWWLEQEQAIDLFLYGRRLWETMSAYWPTGDQQRGASAAEIAFARNWRDTPKVVFSSTLEPAERAPAPAARSARARSAAARSAATRSTAARSRGTRSAATRSTAARPAPDPEAGDLGWNTRLVRGDAVAEIARLKTEEGGPMRVGGAMLGGSAMRAGLVDEYTLVTHPVLVGGGEPFFDALTHWVRLELVETRTFAGAVVMARYRTPRYRTTD